MSTPYRFGRQSNFTQLQYSLPAPRVAKAPIHNPYDKFTQQEFDAWIGGITSSLKRALGEDELEEAPKASKDDVDSSSDDDERVVSQLLEDDEDNGSIDDEVEDSFAELRARRMLGKGKARDPREGPGFGKGDQAQPIEILSDSDEEDLASSPARAPSDEEYEDDNAEREDLEEQDEGSEELFEEEISEEEEEEEEEEEGGPPWDTGESSAQARLRQLYQSQSHPRYADNYEDEEGSYEEGDLEEDDEEGAVYEEDDELDQDEEEYTSDLRHHVRTKSQSPDDDVILVESSDEEKEEQDALHKENQEYSDAEHSDLVYGTQQSSPPGPGIPDREQLSQSPEVDHGPLSIPLHPSYEDVFDAEDEEDEDEELSDDVIEVLDDERDRKTRQRGQTPDQVQPLTADTSFPPPQLSSAREGLPVELPDPWLGPQMYAQDYYSGGDLHPVPGVSLDADYLGSEDEEEVQEVSEQEINGLDEEEEETIQEMPNVPQNPEATADYNLPIHTDHLEGPATSIVQPIAVEPTSSTQATSAGASLEPSTEQESSSSISASPQNRFGDHFTHVMRSCGFPESYLQGTSFLYTAEELARNKALPLADEEDVDMGALDDGSDTSAAFDNHLQYPPDYISVISDSDDDSADPGQQVETPSVAKELESEALGVNEEAEQQPSKESKRMDILDHFNALVDPSLRITEADLEVAGRNDADQAEPTFSQDYVVPKTEAPLPVAVEGADAEGTGDSCNASVDDEAPAAIPVQPEPLAPLVEVSAESTTPPSLSVIESSETQQIESPQIEDTAIQGDSFPDIRPASPSKEEEQVAPIEVPSIAVIETEPSPPPSPKAPAETIPQGALNAEIQINIVEATPDPSPLLHDFEDTWGDSSSHIERMAEPDTVMDWIADDAVLSEAVFNGDVIKDYGVEEPVSGVVVSNVLSKSFSSPEKHEVELLDEEVHSNIDEYFSLDGYGEDEPPRQESPFQHTTQNSREASVLDRLYEDLQVDTMDGLETENSHVPIVDQLPTPPADQHSVTEQTASVISHPTAVPESQDILPVDIVNSASAAIPVQADVVISARADEGETVGYSTTVLHGLVAQGPVMQQMPTTHPVLPPIANGVEFIDNSDSSGWHDEDDNPNRHESDQSQTTVAEYESPPNIFAALPSETQLEVIDTKEAEGMSKKETGGAVNVQQELLKDAAPQVIPEETNLPMPAPCSGHELDETEAILPEQPVLADVRSLPAEAMPELALAGVESNVAAHPCNNEPRVWEETTAPTSTLTDQEPTLARNIPSAEEIKGPDLGRAEESLHDAAKYSVERRSSSRSQTPTQSAEVHEDVPIVQPPKSARKVVLRHDLTPDAPSVQTNTLADQAQLNDYAPVELIFPIFPSQPGIPVEMFAPKSSHPMLLADPYPYNLSTPTDPYNGPKPPTYDTETVSPSTSPSTSSTSTSTDNNSLGFQQQRAIQPASEQIPGNDVPSEQLAHASNDADAEGDADPEYGHSAPVHTTSHTIVSPRMLSMTSPTQTPRNTHQSPASYKRSPTIKDRRNSDIFPSSPLSSVSGIHAITNKPSSPTDELPSILVAKKPAKVNGAQEEHNEQTPSLKRKRESFSSAPSSLSKKAPPKPKAKKSIKAETLPTQKKLPKPRKEKGKAKEAGQPGDLRSYGSGETPSRASSIASSAPSDAVHQSSPSVASKESKFRPPAPPPPRTMPPSLMHRHSHALPQSSGLRQYQAPSTRHLDRDTPTSRSQRERASFSSYSSPVTRSNCRYHKISIPRDEDGPRIMFLVPGCTLGDQELIEEEEIEDLGDATVEDTREIIQDLDSLDLDPYLVGVLRLLVGVKMLSEREVYYMARKGDDGKDLVTRKPQKTRQWYHVDHGHKSADSPTTPTAATLNHSNTSGYPGLDTDSSSVSESEEDEYRPNPSKKARNTGSLARRATHPTASTASRGVKRTNTAIAHDQDSEVARQTKKQRANAEEEETATLLEPSTVFIPYNGPSRV